ncbi:hypothetical protein FGIG_05003 [Fasciola gigantica]|uniref:Uncharacterized protein n=1 Tax=Fasciola gigantica TaxID=46835 RepID=A0A504YUY9_FASGI|nr:hypothetical protein FGIG_05003 [Fasciola gigantica]
MQYGKCSKPESHLTRYLRSALITKPKLKIAFEQTECLKVAQKQENTSQLLLHLCAATTGTEQNQGDKSSYQCTLTTNLQSCGKNDIFKTFVMQHLQGPKHAAAMGGLTLFFITTAAASNDLTRTITIVEADRVVLKALVDTQSHRCDSVTNGPWSLQEERLLLYLHE